MSSRPSSTSMPACLRIIRCAPSGAEWATSSENSRLSDDLCEASGRPGIPPGQLLKARILMALYAVRNEHRFCGQPGDNLPWLWFPDREFSRGRFKHGVFARKSERLFSAGVSGRLRRLARPEPACAD